METDKRSINNKLKTIIITFFWAYVLLQGGVDFDDILPTKDVKVLILTRPKRGCLGFVRQETVQFECVGYNSIEAIPDYLIEELTKKRISFPKQFFYEFYIVEYPINPVAYENIFEIYNYPASSDCPIIHRNHIENTEKIKEDEIKKLIKDPKNLSLNINNQKNNEKPLSVETKNQTNLNLEIGSKKITGKRVYIISSILLSVLLFSLFYIKK